MKIVLLLACASMLFCGVQSWMLEADQATVVVLSGSSVVIKCRVIPAEEDSANASLFHVWKNEDTELLTFQNNTVEADKNVVSVGVSNTEMWLKITKVDVSHESQYRCSLMGVGDKIEASIDLIVEQHPKVTLETFSDVSPIEDEDTRISKCSATGSKPKPTIWYTDQDGIKIDTLDEVVEEPDESDNGLVNTYLTLHRTFTREDHNRIFKCHVRHPDGTEFTEQTEAVNVRYAPSAIFSSVAEHERKYLQETDSFETYCIAEGNPDPVMSWEFVPDENVNITMDSMLPENFERSSDMKKLYSNGVTLTDATSTNNGTFTCKVSNGIGAESSISFHLGVYALPVTTAPPTTEVVTEKMAQTAGSDAAVIGGVVAVALFVLIVAIVLIVRYFMSHKGTYHTHEMKTNDLEENRREESDEHNQMLNEDDENELEVKKRTEYFM